MHHQKTPYITIKTKRSRRLSAVVLCLAVTVLLTCLLCLPTAVGASDQVMQTLDMPSFRDPNGTDMPISKGDVVSGLLGEISPAEVGYLNAHGQYVLYTSDIPADHVYAHVVEDGITVLAYDYSYTTAEGVDVTWMPLFAENATTPSELVDLLYHADLNLYQGTLEGSGTDRVKVYFAASFTLPEDVALALVNEAPAAAEKLISAMTAYEQAMAEWRPRKEAYDAYVEAYRAWEKATSEYEAYLAARANYDAWWEDYNLKKAAMDDYLEQKSAYEAWIQYGIDLKAYEDYMALVNASPELKAAYEAKMKTVLSQMAVMDRMFIVSKISGYSFEGVLNSGAADYVINNRDLLLNISGVNPDDVYLAVSATRALRKLVDGYAVLSDPEARYEYYMANGATMAGHVTDLYRSMVALGEVDYVYKEIEDRGGMDAYLQFLGNLYVQGSLMDDATTLDKDHTLFGRALTQLVEEELLLADHDQMVPLEAYPHPPTTSDDIPEVPYPGDPPPKAEDPGEAPAPVPDVAQAPKEPAEVLPAGEAPAEVADPGDEPSAPSMTLEERALYEAAQEGNVPFRTAEDLPYGGYLSVVASKEIGVLADRSVKIVMMRYRNGDYAVYSTKHVPFGASLAEVLTPPKATAPNGAPLTFVGWSLDPTPLPDTVEQVYVPMEITDAVIGMTLYPVYRLYHVPVGEATCTTDQTCRYCHEVLMEATGHTPGDAATCTEDQICTVCHEVLDKA